MERIMKLCVRIVLFIILFANVLLLCYYWKLFKKDIFDASSRDTDAVTDCPPFLIPCFGYCCPPGITYCNSQRRDCEPYASNRFLNFILVRSADKGPSYYVEKPMLQKIPTMNSERTDVSNDISDVSNVNAETVTDCPPFLIPCFGACCPPIITYCNSQRRDCEPTASNRLLNLILVRSSGKGPSSVEEPMLQEVPAINSERTDISNDASGMACLDTETQCARGCCPYSNGSCCTDTCCPQGAVCLGPLNACLGIKKDEKNSENPVLYSEKSVNLRQVNDCPPFMIPCFDTCCPPVITYCNSQRRDCEPQRKYR